LYDVRADLTAASPSIKIEYRANIMQNTGEDWDGVALTLSTASPLLASDIPKVRPWRITVPRPQIVRSVRKKSLGFIQYGRAAADGDDSFSRASEPHIVRLEGGSDDATVPAGFWRADVGPAVQVSKGAISSTFAIEGLSTIPSDNSSHKVSIAVSCIQCPAI